MYQALYRKYRPKRFADVIGQEAVTRTLRAQIESGHIGHAYLFTGTRGTGKTTCAKIFAKAVNCAHPTGGDPCNECEACRGIAEDSVTDIYEIDAASNNSVGDVRELREDVIYTPAAVRYKVYIIDEVHRMSGQAFDALLKTIEEPPAHVIFILATTELHKVPATILSRCQRFDFRRIDAADIAGRLSEVARAEGLALSEDAAALLGRMGQGSMRDALSLLERAAALQGNIDAAAVGDLLGLCDPEKLLGCAEKIAAGDSAGVLAFLDEMWRSSKDIGRLLSELGVLYRDIMLVHTAPELTRSTHTESECERMRALHDRMGLARILASLEMLQKGMRDFSMTGGSRIMTEITLLRLCDLRLAADPESLLARIERLEAKISGAPIAQAKAPAVKQPPETAKSEAPAKPKESVPPSRLWSVAIEQLKTMGRQDLVGTLSDITPTVRDQKVIFELEAGFIRTLLSSDQNKRAICDALRRVDGKDYTVSFVDPAPEQSARDALDDLIAHIEQSE